MNKQKLELTWIGKDKRPRLEPRVLLEDPTRSYHAGVRRTELDQFDNRLIFGDNLLALKALEAEFTGKVKCVYIDPPFNTRQAFEHYDDGLEHSVWLALMRDRVEILHRLLAPSGSMFVHIDDNELGYLIVLLDEVFGRANRIGIVTFKQSSASGPKAINPGLVTTNNYILYYARDKSQWAPDKVFVPTTRDGRYGKFIESRDEPPNQWKLLGLREAFQRAARCATWDDVKAKYADKLEEKLHAFVLANADRVVRTARVADADVNESARSALAMSRTRPTEVFTSEREGKSTYYFLGGEQLIFYSAKAKVIDRVLQTASPLTNLWDDLLSNNLHAEGGVTFPDGKKPEALIKRCLELATGPGDLVLDSFAGSGTTGAVAHKMRRRWIMVELGEHCHTHVLPRMRRVVDGADASGITEAVEWKGGGGFRYYGLAPSLLAKDQWGNWTINPAYDGARLSEALCKLEGFTWAPSETRFWQHGHSSERDFIYVTTQNLTGAQLEAISADVGEQRSLLILASAWHGVTAAQAATRLPNLTLKKIPKAVLARCEWGRDDYSLNVANLPLSAPNPVAAEAAGPTAAPAAVPAKKQKRAAPRAPDLFDGDAS